MQHDELQFISWLSCASLAESAALLHTRENQIIYPRGLLACLVSENLYFFVFFCWFGVVARCNEKDPRRTGSISADDDAAVSCRIYPQKRNNRYLHPMGGSCGDAEPPPLPHDTKKSELRIAYRPRAYCVLYRHVEEYRVNWSALHSVCEWIKDRARAGNTTWNNRRRSCCPLSGIIIWVIVCLQWGK